MTHTVTYRLLDDATKIRQVQEATLNTEEFGLQPTHGLHGTPEWWGNIASGVLPMHTLKGMIIKVYMGSMGDWPEFRVREEDGTESSWTREAQSRELDAAYQIGCSVEVDYVVERFKAKSWSGPEETKSVVEIRVGSACNEA
ncbi:hypothetical protein C1O66_18020 [Paucibacter aquatile]|uniref:Uncharacterized protein n=1 Tax=Kinneretia aquatilis TaxID=2070761 RepID=A0A2N8L0K7_9BURK|nr:hypothetical protein [Paucibacter aquatile]PND39236.1 hypothetical protein C1O66_18020 [Paucibacter aquatile]